MKRRIERTFSRIITNKKWGYLPKKKECLDFYLSCQGKKQRKQKRESEKTASKNTEGMNLI